jgi:hypothetical protein
VNIDINKIFEMITYFLDKEGKPMSKVKLNALLLLSDLKFMEEYNKSITLDTIYCSSDCPILQIVDQVMNGTVYKTLWDIHVFQTISRTFIMRKPKRKEFLEPKEFDIVKWVYTNYGDLDEGSLRMLLKSRSIEWC